MVGNIIRNPGFYDVDSYWQAEGGAVFAPSVGNDQLGAASLPAASASIYQEVTLPERPSWTLEAYLYGLAAGNATITILNSDLDTVYTATVALTGSTWEQWTATIGLPPDRIHIKFEYNNVAFYVDDVSVAHVPKTRYQLAVLAHAEVQDLVSGISSFVAPSYSSDEGSYTAAIDAALMWVGAVNTQGDPDVRWLEREQVDQVIDKIVEEILTGPVLGYYQGKVDVSLGPRRESYSQIANGIRQRYGLVPGATHSGQRRMMTIDLTH